MALYTQYVRAYWQTDSLAQGQPAKAGATVVVKPLLGDIAWGQDAPFNDQCPTYTDGGTTTHYYTGCVAAAAGTPCRCFSGLRRMLTGASCSSACTKVL